MPWAPRRTQPLLSLLLASFSLWPRRDAKRFFAFSTIEQSGVAAIAVGAKADTLGRKPMFLIGFLVHAARGALYTFSDNPYWLVAVQ